MTSTIILFLICLVVFEFNTCLGMFLSGSESSHLRYPQLSFCQNSSISLDFKTTASPEALLVYTDDLSRGRPDYLEISYDTSGHVTALVRDENRRKFRIGPYLLNDGRWHRVELRKVNSKIYLILDGIVTTAAYAYGESGTDGQLTGDELQLPATTSDQYRGGSYVYVGGLPAGIRENPGLISLPSAALKRSLNGYIRNVIYRNCTCQTARIRHIDGSGFVDYPPSKCDDGSRRCLKGCTCVLTDNEPLFKCDCSEKHCVDSMLIG